MDKPQKRSIWVVICVMLGTTTVSLNNSTINPAIPVFVEDFDLSPVLATWIMVTFMATMGITMPLTNYLSQLWNRKYVYITGACLFFIGSAIGMYAQSIQQLLIARGIQGIASGLMIPLSLAIIFSVYPKNQRGRVTGIWGAAVMLAPAFGPLIGSLMLTFYSWHSLFIINLPFALITIALGVKVLPSSRRSTDLSFDGVGYTLIALALAITLVTTGQLKNAEARQDLFTFVQLAIGIACLVAFVFWSLKRESPLLNIRLFNNRGYRSSVVITVAQAIGMFECLFLLPILIQSVLGYSPIITGMMLLVTALSASLSSHWGGKQLDQQGPNRIVSLGLLINGMSTIGIGFVTTANPIWVLALLSCLRGTGLGLSYIPITTAGISTLPDSMITQGAVMNNISRRLCASITLLLGAIWLEINTSASHTNIEYASAISDVFIAVGLLTITVVPLAWCFPTKEDYSLHITD
ncbi:DHA2 family efflux MFS transporter permease subunit [Vibrio kasasachensis]|uniref:DHA2 family efflux MFS transporter permease subunit n=1 Tax=Vibrio kasasachensis TaxID=2910248 RepID=UPI003D12E4AE